MKIRSRQESRCWLGQPSLECIALQPPGELVAMGEGDQYRIASSGVFVEDEDDIVGLVHISQLSKEHVAKVKGVIKAASWRAALEPAPVASLPMSGLKPHYP